MDGQPPEAPRCTAKAKGTQSRCKRRPTPGADVCVMHGGKAPQVQAAAKRNVERMEVQREMVTLGVPVDVEPTEALLDLVRRSAGHVAWLAQRVAELDEAELTWGRAQHEEGHTDKGPVDLTTHKAGGHAVYQLYLSEREHLAKVSALAIRAGVDERRVALAEAQALQVAGLIRRILARLPLDATARRDADVIVVEELQALEGTAS